MDELQIAFIGAGNMATSIIGGLIEQGMPASNLRASDPFPESLQRLQQTAPITTSAENSEVVAGADVVILAVKPQVMAQVTRDISAAVSAANAVVISIAAGITIASLQAGLGEPTAIVRCMPNTPALLRAGATALYANASTSEQQRISAGDILAAVGSVCWVEQEEQLDAVTALSGSGPAYFFLFMEAMTEAGAKLGLDEATSRDLALQTGLGACRMATEGDVDLRELRRRVTSPGGTTESAVQSFEKANLRGIVAAAMQAALDRAREMSREMG
ncbi:MAG: pyrroline-5-carboxylate reductase [Gammaproteobacteria bacterium]|nr:pyrroline-5-carboxylate reductase [Gammaproteobacteria bacterium]